jgi:hypothetical protein
MQVGGEWMRHRRWWEEARRKEIEEGPGGARVLDGGWWMVEVVWFWVGAGRGRGRRTPFYLAQLETTRTGFGAACRCVILIELAC